MARGDVRLLITQEIKSATFSVQFKQLDNAFVVAVAGDLLPRLRNRTPQGIAMLSSVLKSDTAIEVNVGIMRAFVEMRQLFTENGDLKLAIESLRTEYDEKFEIVFKALDRILAMEPNKSKPIGFIWPSYEPDS